MNIRRGLKHQETVYKIVEGLNIAVMEIDPQKPHIGFCNQKANQFLKDIYRHQNPRKQMPDILTKNDFLKFKYAQGHYEEDIALQNELLCTPAFKSSSNQQSNSNSGEASERNISLDELSRHEALES